MNCMIPADAEVLQAVSKTRRETRNGRGGRHGKRGHALVGTVETSGKWLTIGGDLHKARLSERGGACKMAEPRLQGALECHPSLPVGVSK